jgi:nitrilase
MMGTKKGKTDMSASEESKCLKVGIAQISPIWLNREKTLDKIIENVNSAAHEGCELVVFGEALLPGYPFWIELTDGARFNAPIQKEIHAHYVQNAIQIEAGHLNRLSETAAEHRVAVVLGCIERPADRGGHSIYASLVYIDSSGVIRSVHRKLMPTYEERLTWSPGDGHGLRVHSIGPFTLGGLNCWENWMPLARAALYGQGEDLHVAIWPGNIRNTNQITRFIAMEARSYVISASGFMRKVDFPPDTPHLKTILKECPDTLANGGSCIAGPDGEWVVEPVIDKEELIVATLDYVSVLKERQNFDPVGHYSRPDVTQLTVNRQRQTPLKIID